MVLPLHDTGRIKTGNALRLDWLEVCPPPKPASAVEEDLGGPTGRLALDAAPEPDGETYICGNPPYSGSAKQSAPQKADMEALFAKVSPVWKSLDYVAGWFLKAADYSKTARSSAAFVSTNSICQGEVASIIWPLLYQAEQSIAFAYTSFKWANLAAHNAGVTVVIVGLTSERNFNRKLYACDDAGSTELRIVKNINPYRVSGNDICVSALCARR